VPGDRKEADLLTRLGDPPGDGASPPPRLPPTQRRGSLSSLPSTRLRRCRFSLH
jgi:hypothetical protein